MNIPLKIFLCCHNKFDIIPPYAVPIQGGSAINPSIQGALSDIGPNGSISEKNREYCELTVQYYAWKNEDLESYGFCHYRRFFCFDENIKQPYLAKDILSQTDVMRLFKSEAEISEIIKDYDIVTVRAEKTAYSVREYYYRSDHLYQEDLDLFVDILQKKYPYLSGYCSQYLDQDRQYFCNMFIMTKPLFNEYCGILFDILEEFDKHKRMHGDFQSDRTDGYLGERFLGIFITYCYDKEVKIKELPRIDTHCTLKKRIIYKLLPPETKRRFFIKRFIERI